MAEHTPEARKWMARFCCVAAGHDPEDWAFGNLQNWEAFLEEADRALDHMAANGWKMTDRECSDDQYRAMLNTKPGFVSMPETTWRNAHDAAPMTPHE